MKNRKVSILIPSYNSGKYIADTIACCQRQTYPDIEVIIVDDGSTDSTYEIAKQYESDNIHIYRQKNAGACKARNYAYSKCTGDFIMFLDADDLMTSDKIESQINILLPSSKNVVTFCRWERFYTDINDAQFKYSPIYKNYNSPINLLTDMWMGKGMLANCCYLIPRSIADKELWNESLCINQDGEYFCRVLLHASKVDFCKKGGVFYRSGLPDSITAKKTSIKKGQCLLDTYISYEHHILPGYDTPVIRQALAMNYCLVAYIYFSFSELVSKACNQYIALNTTVRVVPIGSVKFRLMSQIIGFWNLLKIKIWILRK